MENNTKKITRKEMFTAVSDFLVSNGASDEMVDFINHQIELVSRKKVSADGTAKPSAAGAENTALAPTFVRAMEFDRDYSSADLMKLPVAEEFNATHEKPLSIPKITNIMSKAIADGCVVKETVKRKTMYRRVI